MKVIKSYISGLKISISSLRMITVIYLITLILSLLFAFSFRGILSSAIGNSMLINPLFEKFDYTLFTEFLNQHKDISHFFISQFLWFGISYLIFSIFVNGGILTMIHKFKCKFHLGEFFKGCAEYFTRFFRLSLIVIILHILFAVIIYISLFAIIDNYSDIVDSESTLVYIAGTGVLFHLFIAGILFILTDYSKIIIVRNDSRKVFRSFWKAIKFAFKHFLAVYFLLLFLILVPLILTLVYFIAESKIGMVSTFTVLVMLLIQQIYICFRIFFKVWFLGSQYNYHDNFFIPDIKEIEPVLIADDTNFATPKLNESETV